MRRQSNKKENKKNNKIIIILVFIIVICIGIIVYLTLIKKPKELEYNPGIIDKNAIFTESDEDKLEKKDGGGAVSLSYSKDVTIDLKNKKVSLHFKNPSRSTQSIVLQIVIIQDDKNIVIAESNRIPPGYSINNLALINELSINENIKGVFNVMYYDDETEEKAIVNTNIPINIKFK